MKRRSLRHLQRKYRRIARLSDCGYRVGHLSDSYVFRLMTISGTQADFDAALFLRNARRAAP
jgi:hypothetical protein